MPLTRRLPLVLAALAFLLGSSRIALGVCSVTSACSATPFLNPASGCCGATSCTIDGTVTQSGPTCTLDFGARNVTLSGTLVVGSNMLTLEAGSLVVTGLINATGTSPNPGGNVTLGLSPGGLSLLGGASSGIDLEGFTAGGGTLTVFSDGPVNLIGGSINANAPNALDTFAGGGTITIQQIVSTSQMTIGIPILANAQINGAGGTTTLQAPGDLKVTDTGRIATLGGAFDGSIELDAGGLLTISGAALIQSDALNGSAGDGGTITFTAGSVLMQGTVQAQGGGDATGDSGGSGGTIAIEATNGSLVLNRGTQGLTADGAGGGDGGEVDLTTDSPAAGMLTIGAPISVQGFGGVSGRPGGGGFIDVASTNRLDVTKSLNVSGIGGGSGGISLQADRDVLIENSLQASDSVGNGEVDIDAGHDLNLTDIGQGHNVKANATTDGPGGAINMVAGNDLTVTGFLLDASGAGTGAGYLISLDAGHKLTIGKTAVLNVDSQATAGAPAGMVLLTAGSGDLTGDLQLDGDVSANGHASAAAAANPAAIILKGCQVTISSTGLVDSTGDLNARNLVIGRAGITINGKLRTSATGLGGSNTANYPMGTMPTVSGASSQVSPAFAACQGGCAKPPCTQLNPPAPSGCLVPCPSCGDHTKQFPEDCDPPGCAAGCDIHCRALPPGCADTNPCSTDTCDSTFGCVHEPSPEGTPCDDNTVCNGRETCTVATGASFCQAGTPLDCDDQNPCTSDSCNAVSGCTHAPITGPPAPGATSCTNHCIETCSSGTCTSITPPNCTGGTSCDPATGQCVAGAPCTTAAQCEDGNPCTNHSCTSGHCFYTPLTNGASCSDGDACNGAETCLNGACKSGTPVNCNDGNACTTDTCNSANGICSNQLIPPPACCNANADCNDSSPCTTDVCTNHECTNTIIPNCCGSDLDCNDRQPCQTGQCISGQCQYTNAHEGMSCGNVCQPATCTAGTCVPGTPLSCPDDNDICTQDFCDPTAGCMHQPIPGCCHNDGECADSSACTTDVCDTGLNVCINNPIFLGCRDCSADTDCDPAGACGLSICGPQGYCLENTPPECTDGNCDTTDTCVVDGPGQAHCTHQPGACTDACNGRSCQGGFCVQGTPTDCDDGDLCTEDGCDPVTGCTHTTKTSFASVACQLDTMDAAIRGASAADLAPPVAGKLGKLIGNARTKLTAAQSAGHGKKAVKALKGVAKQLKAIGRTVRAAQKKHKIGTLVANAIQTAINGGNQALATLKASVTP